MVHSHNTRNSFRHKNAFLSGIILNIGFVVIEVIYGLIANSSALLADAGHNASDVLGLVFAWTAVWLSSVKPKGKYTYGLRKTTILVSILNALILFGAAAVICRDAVIKLQNPEPVAGKQIMIVAGIGVVINTLTALLFIKGHKEDLNIKSAFLHMAADAAVSLGVVIAGLLINLTGKLWIDPIVSFIIIAVIIRVTWRLFMDSLSLALDAVPKNIDLEKVRNYIEKKEGVEGLHDLHIWAMSTTETAMTAHLVMPKGSGDAFITGLQKELKEKFGIGHTTFQIEKRNLGEKCDICS